MLLVTGALPPSPSPALAASSISPARLRPGPHRAAAPGAEILRLPAVRREGSSRRGSWHDFVALLPTSGEIKFGREEPRKRVDRLAVPAAARARRSSPARSTPGNEQVYPGPRRLALLPPRRLDLRHRPAVPRPRRRLKQRARDLGIQGRNPVKAIVDFKEQLKARGDHAPGVVPVSAKTGNRCKYAVGKARSSIHE